MRNYLTAIVLLIWSTSASAGVAVTVGTGSAATRGLDAPALTTATPRVTESQREYSASTMSLGYVTKSGWGLDVLRVGSGFVKDNAHASASGTLIGSNYFTEESSSRSLDLSMTAITLSKSFRLSQSVDLRLNVGGSSNESEITTVRTQEDYARIAGVFYVLVNRTDTKEVKYKKDTDLTYGVGVQFKTGEYINVRVNVQKFEGINVILPTLSMVVSF